MTALNFTIGSDRSFAVVSADSALASLSLAAANVEARTASADDAERSAKRNPGPPAALIGTGAKLLAMPHLQAIVAGCGSNIAILDFASYFLTVPPGFGDFLAAVERAEKVLPAIGARNVPFVVAAVGWVPESNAVAGFVWASGEAFRRTELGPGHSMQPAFDTTADDYDAIAQAWRLAAAGFNTLEFHLALLRNQSAACRAGKYNAGSVIAPPFQLARIDADAIMLKVFDA